MEKVVDTILEAFERGDIHSFDTSKADREFQNVQAPDSLLNTKYPASENPEALIRGTTATGIVKYSAQEMREMVKKALQTGSTVHAMRGKFTAGENKMLYSDNPYNPNFNLIYHGTHERSGIKPEQRIEKATLKFNLALQPDTLHSAQLTPEMFDTSIGQDQGGVAKTILKHAKNFILTEKNNKLFPLYGNLWTLTDDVKINLLLKKTGVSKANTSIPQEDLQFDVKTKSGKLQPVQFVGFDNTSSKLEVRKIKGDGKERIIHSRTSFIPYRALPGMNGKFEEHPKPTGNEGGFDNFFRNHYPLPELPDSPTPSIETGKEIEYKHTPKAPNVDKVNIAPLGGAYTKKDIDVSPETGITDIRTTMAGDIKREETAESAMKALKAKEKARKEKESAGNESEQRNESTNIRVSYKDFFTEAIKNDSPFVTKAPVPVKTTETSRKATLFLKFGISLEGMLTPNSFAWLPPHVGQGIADRDSLDTEKMSSWTQYLMTTKAGNSVVILTPSVAAMARQKLRTPTFDPDTSEEKKKETLASRSHSAAIAEDDIRAATKPGGKPAQVITNDRTNKSELSFHANHQEILDYINKHGFSLYSVTLTQTRFGKDLAIPADLIDWEKTTAYSNANPNHAKIENIDALQTAVPIIEVSLVTNIGNIIRQPKNRMGKSARKSYLHKYREIQAQDLNPNFSSWDLQEILPDSVNEVHSVPLESFTAWYDQSVGNLIGTLARDPSLGNHKGKIIETPLRIKPTLMRKYSPRPTNQPIVIPQNHPLTYKPLLDLMYGNKSDKLMRDGFLYEYDKNIQDILFTKFINPLPPHGRIDTTLYKDENITNRFVELLNEWGREQLVDPHSDKVPSEFQESLGPRFILDAYDGETTLQTFDYKTGEGHDLRDVISFEKAVKHVVDLMRAERIHEKKERDEAVYRMAINEGLTVEELRLLGQLKFFCEDTEDPKSETEVPVDSDLLQLFNTHLDGLYDKNKLNMDSLLELKNRILLYMAFESPLAKGHEPIKRTHAAINYKARIQYATNSKVPENNKNVRKESITIPTLESLLESILTKYR